MIDEKIAIRQSLRLSGLGGFPRTPEALDELVNTLRSSSRSPEHAARIVSEWLRSNRFAPTPADIFELAQKFDPETKPINWRCAVCGGTGWEPIHQLVTWRDGRQKDIEEVPEERYLDLLSHVSGRTGEQVVQPAVKRCLHCAIGRRRAQAEQAEKAAA